MTILKYRMKNFISELHIIKHSYIQNQNYLPFKLSKDSNTVDSQFNELHWTSANRS